jgi:hypothetical protein
MFPPAIVNRSKLLDTFVWFNKGLALFYAWQAYDGIKSIIQGLGAGPLNVGIIVLTAISLVVACGHFACKRWALKFSAIFFAITLPFALLLALFGMGVRSSFFLGFLFIPNYLICEWFNRNGYFCAAPSKSEDGFLSLVAKNAWLYRVFLLVNKVVALLYFWLAVLLVRDGVDVVIIFLAVVLLAVAYGHFRCKGWAIAGSARFFTIASLFLLLYPPPPDSVGPSSPLIVDKFVESIDLLFLSLFMILNDLAYKCFKGSRN